MNRHDAFNSIGYAVDDALCQRKVSDVPSNATLVVWWPHTVIAVFSYMPDIKVPNDLAEEIAQDLADELGLRVSPTPDQIL